MRKDTFNTQVEKATWDICNKLRTHSAYSMESVISAAYLLYLTGKQNYAFKHLDEIINNDCLATEKKYFLTNFIKEETWQLLYTLTTEYPMEIFKEIILSFENIDSCFTTTPISIIKLAKKILKIKKNENVADICSGTGTFLLNSAAEIPNAHYYGYDSKLACKDITDIRASLAKLNIQTETVDVFTLAEELKLNMYFDKLFSNYPLGTRVRNMTQQAQHFINTSLIDNSYIFPSTSAEWVFNLLLLRLMKKSGKAIALMPNGACFNKMDLQARHYFIKNGFVEAVIALPKSLFNDTSIPVTMIVLSNSNKSVRMVDATQMFKKGRRKNELTEKNIEDILLAYNNDTDNSISIPNDELKNNEYALSPQYYLSYNIPKDKQKNYLAFKEVLKKIKRSAPIKASLLDELASEEETNIKYLRLQDIQNGMINDNLHSLKKLEPRFSQYLLKNGELILSKIGTPYKAAVIQITPQQAILPIGNMYIIELDTTKINPYYLKAFFESAQGASALRSITTGVTIPVISVERLKNLLIPVPSMMEQNKVAKEYLAILDEIKILKLKLEKATDRLNHVFDNVKEEI